MAMGILVSFSGDLHLEVLTRFPGLWPSLPALASQFYSYLFLRLSGIEHQDQSLDDQLLRIAASPTYCTMRYTHPGPMTRWTEITQ